MNCTSCSFTGALNGEKHKKAHIAWLRMTGHPIAETLLVDRFM